MVCGDEVKITRGALLGMIGKIREFRGVDEPDYAPPRAVIELNAQNRTVEVALVAIERLKDGAKWTGSQIPKAS